MSATKYFEVKLKHGHAGRPEVQQRTLRGLGLTRFGKTVYLKDTPQIRGMIYKVVHLVDVMPREGTPPKTGRRDAKKARESRAS